VATLVRWVVRVVTAILAFLLFETGVAGIPDSIASQYAFLSSLNEEWLIRLAALVLGFILALAAIGPHRVQAWIRWAAPNQALSLDSPDANSQADSTPEISVQEWWRERIKEWRSVIHDFDLDRPDDRRRFLRTDAYSQMKECGLKPEVIKMFEAQRTLHVGNEARGDTAYQYTLLDEVARIEKERVLNAPEPATNQAAPAS
jgi:hypothetical protein